MKKSQKIQKSQPKERPLYEKSQSFRFSLQQPARLSLLESEEFADTCVKCGEKTILCHSFVLCETSSVLKERLKRQDDGKYSIEFNNSSELSETVLRKILRSFYGAELSFDSNKEFKEVFKFAKNYSVAPLFQFCLDRLYAMLTVENFDAIHRVAKEMCEKTTKQDVELRLVETFLQQNQLLPLQRMKDLKHLHPDSLIQLVKDVRINIHDENQAFATISIWFFGKNYEKFAPVLPRIVEASLRLHLLSAKTVQNAVNRARPERGESAHQRRRQSSHSLNC